jgi:malate dehydrogenase (oxaloacetate-decarboxylating)(NADP+)
MESGVATRPIADFDAYHEQLMRFVYRTDRTMRPVFTKAREHPQRVVFAEGEEERVLRAAQTLVDEGLAQPILIGRPQVVSTRIARLGLRLEEGRDFALTNPESDERFGEYWRLYHHIMERSGVTPDRAREVVRTRNTVIAALMIRRGEADAGICGVVGGFAPSLSDVRDIIGAREGVLQLSALSLVILPRAQFFMLDTHVTDEPTVDALVEMTLMAADEIRGLGIEPKVAFLSNSNFGSRANASAAKMREAVARLAALDPDFEFEGEMQADTAFSETVRARLFPNSRLSGAPNLLVLPNLDSANIAFNLLRQLGDGLSVGPMLLGTKWPMHVVSPTITARGLLNLAAVAVVDAQKCGRGPERSS